MITTCCFGWLAVIQHWFVDCRLCLSDALPACASRWSYTVTVKTTNSAAHSPEQLKPIGDKWISAVFEKTCATTPKYVKSHVFWILKKNVKNVKNVQAT